jgi:DNA-binding IclR family transcriptional regulator
VHPFADPASSVAAPDVVDRGTSAVARAFRVVELLAEQPRSASATARATGVNRSTALRLLQDLEATGYVARDAVTKQYSTVPMRFFALVASHQDHADWSEAIDPVLAELRDESGEATMLGVPANGAMVYLAYFPSTQLVAVRERLGTVRPMHASALGKAYLAALPTALLDVELGRLNFEGGSPLAAKGPIELRERLDTARGLGYAVDRNETFEGVACVAAPVHIGSTLIGAIGVSGPSSRFTDDRIAEIGARVQERARSVDARQR